MNYFKTYNHFYIKSYAIAKRMVINEMKKEKLKKRPFTTVHNKICKFLYDYYSIKYTEDLKTRQHQSFKLFCDRHLYYDGDNDVVITLVLEDEVLNAFNKEDKSSYVKFVSDLAIESSLKEAQRHFKNYKDYYELIYDLDMYDNFYFEDFESITFTSSNEYKSMIDIKHPYLKQEREASLNSSTTDVEKGSTLLVEVSEKHNIYLNLINNFEDDEKYLLINIFNSLPPDSLKRTDFLKLIRIVGTFQDLTIFYKNPKSVTPYAKVSKGIDYYSGKRKLDIIDRTLVKMEPFQIDAINHQLSKMKSQVNK